MSRFELNNEGLCSFEVSFDRIEHYQLLEGSRFSFLGCWLFLQPTKDGTDFSAEHNYTRKRVFIYRDSLSAQDFSRVSNVISQLNNHP